MLTGNHDFRCGFAINLPQWDELTYPGPSLVGQVRDSPERWPWLWSDQKHIGMSMSWRLACSKVKPLLKQSKRGLEKNFQTQWEWRGVSLLRTKIRERVGPASTVGQPPDRPGKIDSFRGVIASFYSLKTKTIPAGRLVLADWLGCDRVFTGRGIFS